MPTGRVVTKHNFVRRTVPLAGCHRRTPPVEMPAPLPPPKWGQRAATADRQGLKRPQ